MFPESVRSANLCEILCHPKICSYSFSDLSMISDTCLCCVLVTVKEYERVVGWEGSDAVSPPRDGAAWTLRNSIHFLRG